jgi:hypothetical protein
VQELIDIPKATILENQYTLKVMMKRERTAALVPFVKGRTRAATQESEGEKKKASWCGLHLGQLLRAVKKNGAPLKCLKGVRCKFKHGKLGDITMEAAVSLVATMPIWMQNCLSPLISNANCFKP